MWILRILLVSIMLAAEIVGQSNNEANSSETITSPAPAGNSSELVPIVPEVTTVTSITENLNSTTLGVDGNFTVTTEQSTTLPQHSISSEPASPTPPAVLPTTVEQSQEEHVTVEPQTVTPTPTTTASTTTTTKKPSPLVIHGSSSAPHYGHDGPVVKLPNSGKTTPKAPPPTPSTPAASTSGLGEILKMPGINLPNLERENAMIDAVQKLG